MKIDMVFSFLSESELDPIGERFMRLEKVHAGSPGAREWVIYRTRAAAVIGSACGLGASPTPDLRESARAVPTYT
jgi:hypothetical protein